MIFPVTPGQVGERFTPAVVPGEIRRTEWNANRTFAKNPSVGTVTSYSSIGGLGFASVDIMFFSDGSHHVWA